ECVGAGGRGKPVRLTYWAGRSLGKPRGKIYPCTTRRTPERQAVYALQSCFYSVQIIGQHAAVARPFLTQRQWSGILHVCASDLDDAIPFPRFRSNCITESGNCGYETLFHIHGGGDAHGRRERVVRRLRHVDMVIGMHRSMASEGSTGELGAPVGDHLIDVHIELCAAACHPNMKRKHVMMPAG